MGLTKLPNASQMGEHLTTRDILHYNVKVGIILGKGEGEEGGREKGGTYRAVCNGDDRVYVHDAEREVRGIKLRDQ